MMNRPGPGDGGIQMANGGMSRVDRNMAMAERVARAVGDAGGRTFYVGGYVRDRLMGLHNKDIDIEVHGISVEALEGILDSLGQRTTMGKSFGVMGLRHYDLDIAMPRSEVATGRGHRDFRIFVDPFIGYERAALRRDFTVNALMQDVLTGEVLDFFGGQADLRRGVLRHVNDSTFAEDPLRVFRAAQFSARFDFAVAPETVALSRGMAVDALARERVMGELEKALMKARRPARFFEVLEDMGQLGTWFEALETANDLQVLDVAAEYRDEAREGLYFTMAALGLLMEEDRLKRFLGTLTDEVNLINYVQSMARAHRQFDPAMDVDRFMIWLDGCVCPEDLVLLEHAAARARGDATLEDLREELAGMLRLYRARMAEPCVMGRDLIKAGMAPGPGMGEALKYVHALRLQGVEWAEQMRRVMQRYAPGD